MKLQQVDIENIHLPMNFVFFFKLRSLRNKMNISFCKCEFLYRLLIILRILFYILLKASAITFDKICIKRELKVLQENKLKIK